MTRVQMYEFIKRLEDVNLRGDVLSTFRFVYGDEFRKLRQILNFYYTHGGK